MTTSPPGDREARQPPETAAEPAAVVRVEHLGYRYRRSDRPALSDLTFSAARGRIVAVLGPNGSGKSTLFRVLCTVLRPTSGRAWIDGHDVVASGDSARGVLGVVFQHASLDVKLTAEENLTHQGRLYGLGGATLRRAVAHALEQAGLSDRRGDLVERFSGGMRRRLELAKAVLHEPRVLILDEPTVGLDPAARRDFMNQLDHLRSSKGVTVLMTTHLMDEADRCDRVVILSGGRLVVEGEPEALKNRIGGDVVVIEPAEGELEQLCSDVASRFGPWPDGGAPEVIGRQIHCETADGATLVGSVTSAFSGRLRRVTVGRPTLEDVYMHITGQGFDGSDANVNAAA